MSSINSPQDQSPPLVDHHQHLFNPTITKLSPGLESVTASDLITVLDSAGIHRGVILSIAYQFGNPNKTPIENEYEQVITENDWTSQQIARFPDRLYGFCGLNPTKDYAIEEIERCAKDPHLNFGLKLHFGNSDVELTNPAHVTQLQTVFRRANDLGMAILVHLRPSVTRERPYGASIAQIFLDDVLTFAPDVPVQIAHLAGAGGYDDPSVDEALAVFIDAITHNDPRMAHVYFDVSGVAGLGQWKEKKRLIASRIQQLGVKRVLFGSDSSFGEFVPSRAWASFCQLPLTHEEISMIGGNVAPYLR